jgi:hypothetical protein
MSNPLLVTHALDNVWCDSEQDFQHIIQPTRLTDPRGVVGTCSVLWRTIQLPTPADRYHVYQIGQVNPASLGLIADVSVWLSLDRVLSQKMVYIQIYTIDGITFPLAQAYIMYTRDRNLIIAVKEQPSIAPLKTTTLYFRFYSNAYFGSIRSDGVSNQLYSLFYQHTNSVAALQFQSNYHIWRAKSGFTVLYLNGAYVNDILPTTLQVGDILEFVYDSTVKKVVDFDIVNLQTFDSIKDAKIKYLLHYAGPQAGDVSIDYRDDCDLFLFQKQPVGQLSSTSFKGVIFHKNQDDAFRQVTHRDYSVTVPYVAAYLTNQPSWGDIAQLTLRLVIRNAGWDRPLVDEAHRIKELYKLAEEDLVNAFLGIDSTVDVWRAPSLENSDYIRLMDAEVAQITLDLVESAYGYNAISRLIGDAPTLLEANPWVELDAALQANSTMYEYDVNGVLLGWYPHVLGAEYSPVYPGAKLIEGIVGNGALAIPQVMGQNNVPIVPGLSYRFYIAPIDLGVVQTNHWTDVTGDNTKYVILNGFVSWLVDTDAFQTCVKSDQAFLAYDLPMSPADGLLSFSVQASVSYPTGTVKEVLTIPVGQLDLWLNGYALIENLDYYVTWPAVVVVNKAYLVPGNLQQLTIRGTGFCNSDLSRTVADDVGFTEWNVLSHNDRFNIRDDKVIRIVGAGRTFSRSQVIFSEDQIQASLPEVPNGSPYAVTDVVVPLRGYCDIDTYVMQAASLVIDAEVSNYLTLHLPDQIPSGPDIIQSLYSVYSPFSSTIAHDLVNGNLPMDNFMGQYSDKDIKDYLVNYTYLLAFDPVTRGVDTGHVSIHPTNLTTELVLDIYQYNFLNRAIQIYLSGKVDISRFISIKTGWI